MNRTALGLALVVAAGTLTLAQQDDLSKVEIKATKVAGAVYMLEGAGGNIGVSIGDDGVLIVDDQFAPLAPKIRDAIKLLFPVVGDNAGAGSTWQGTAAVVAARLSVVDLDESVQVVGTAGAAANENGQKFIPITVIRTTAGQGSGSQAGQPIDLAATGRDSLVYQLSNDGQVLAAEGERVRDMTLTATAVGQTVPVTQESRLKFSLLR